MDIRIAKYRDELEAQWNSFNASSANGCFFFDRSFLAYHSNRFTDHSLLFYNHKNSLIAILPAVQIKNRLASHPGLTFGGLVYQKSIKSSGLEEVFNELKKYLKANALDKFNYKPTPYFYSDFQSPVDQYYLIKNGAVLQKIQLCYLIDLKTPLKFSSLRNRLLKKLQTPLLIEQNEDLKNFYNLLATELKKKFDTTPLHSLSDLQYLMMAFPENIKIYSAIQDGKKIGGILVFIFRNIIKTQYIISNDIGIKNDIISQIVRYLHQKYSPNHNYLDLGTAHEEANNLNKGLVFFKESLGAKPHPLYSYELEI